MKSNLHIFRALINAIIDEGILLCKDPETENSALIQNKKSFGIILGYKGKNNLIKLIASLAHEYGHFLDCDRDINCFKRLERYYLVDLLSNPQYYSKWIVQAEENAWKNADRVLDSLGFNIKNKRYQRFRAECLDSYKKERE